MFVIVYGDIADIDYVSVVGPFESKKEAFRQGALLTEAGKLPDEHENGGETAWRVEELGAPENLPAYE